MAAALAQIDILVGEAVSGSPPPLACTPPAGPQGYGAGGPQREEC
jgi:hypothetical protein